MNKKALYSIFSVFVVLALLASTTKAYADGIITWTGNGSENLPCPNGGHWVLAPAFGIDSATLTVNNWSGEMAPSGNGSWSADSPGPIDSNSTAFVSYTGPGDRRDHLQLSHCTGGGGTPPPPPTETPTSTPLPTDTPTATQIPTETQTADPTNTATATGIPGSTATVEPPATPTPTLQPGVTPTPGSSPWCLDGITYQVPIGQEPPPGATPGACVWHKLPPLSCPECGAGFPVIGGPKDLIIGWYASDCLFNAAKYCIYVEDSSIYGRAELPFKILVSASPKTIDAINKSIEEKNKAKGTHRPLVVYHTEPGPLNTTLVYIDGQAFVSGLDGKTYYEIDVPREATGGYLVLYGKDGTRWRDAYGLDSVHIWILCSRTVGPWDVGTDMMLYKADPFGGPVDWDYEVFFQEFGFAKNFDEAYQLTLQLYKDGFLDLSKLPRQ